MLHASRPPPRSSQQLPRMPTPSPMYPCRLPLARLRACQHRAVVLHSQHKTAPPILSASLPVQDCCSTRKPYSRMPPRRSRWGRRSSAPTARSAPSAPSRPFCLTFDAWIYCFGLASAGQDGAVIFHSQRRYRLLRRRHALQVNGAHAGGPVRRLRRRPRGRRRRRLGAVPGGPLLLSRRPGTSFFFGFE